MNSEIRASSALSSAAAQVGPAELSIQNPLFSIGAQDAFPHVLKKQVSDRQDASRPGVSTSSRHEHKKLDVRRDTQASDRQDSGKRLPDRVDPSVVRKSSTEQRSSRTDDKAVQSSSENLPATEAANGDNVALHDVVVSGESNKGHEDNQTDLSETVTDIASDSALVAATVVPQLPAEPIAPVINVEPDAETDSALAELALLQAQPDVINEQKMMQADAGDQLQGVDAQDGQQSLAVDVSGQEGLVGAALAAELKQTEDVSLENAAARQALADESSRDAVAELQAQAVAQDFEIATELQSTVPHMETLVRPQGQSEASSSQVSASNVTEGNAVAARLDTQHAGAGANDNDDADSTGMEQWKSGPQTTQADKNAEARADFSRALAAAPDKSGQLKEQLAMLAQQVNAAAPTAEKKAETSKSDTVSDIRPTVFSRSLEQLSSARTESGKPVSTGIQTPVYSKEWAGEMGQRLVMMMSSKLKSAEIHLNPRDLGPVEVRIRMHEDKAHVVFTSQVAQTREALELAVPRLREMLDQNGVALGNVDVQDHGARQSHQQEQAGDGRRSRDGSGSGSAEPLVENENIAVRMVGLVDYYA